jgi:hypothetical protein
MLDELEDLWPESWWIIEEFLTLDTARTSSEGKRPLAVTDVTSYVLCLPYSDRAFLVKALLMLEEVLKEMTTEQSRETTKGNENGDGN